MKARTAAQEFVVLVALVMVSGCDDGDDEPRGASASTSGSGGDAASNGSGGGAAAGSGGDASGGDGGGGAAAAGGSGGGATGGSGSGGAATVADCVSYCELRNTCPGQQHDCAADCTPLQGLAAMCGAELSAYYTCMSADPSFYCRKNERQCDEEVDGFFQCVAVYCDAHPEDTPVCD